MAGWQGLAGGERVQAVSGWACSCGRCRSSAAAAGVVCETRGTRALVSEKAAEGGCLGVGKHLGAGEAGVVVHGGVDDAAVAGSVRPLLPAGLVRSPLGA